MPTTSHPLAATGALKYNSVAADDGETATITVPATAKVYHALYFLTAAVDVAAKIFKTTVSVAGVVVWTGHSDASTGHFPFDKPIVADPGEILLVTMLEVTGTGGAFDLSTGIVTSATPVEAAA